MRVVLVTHYFSTHRGGVEIVAHRLAEELCNGQGVVIEWFASDCDRTPEDRAAGLSFNPARSCNALEVRTGLPWPLWHPSCLPALWRAIGRADCVHLHEYIYFGNLCALAIAWLHHRPVLLTQHIGFIPYDNGWLRWTLSLANRTVGRIVLGRVARVAFVSAEVMRYFGKFSSFRGSPKLIRNGVDREVFRFADRDAQIAARRTLALDDTAPVFLFVGRFVEKKGLRLLRDLVERSPGITWLFAGGGKEDPSAWGLPNARVFRGRSGSGLAELYQAADLLVIPSKGEGFPLVVQESMSCGTPVFASAEWFADGAVPSTLSFSEPVMSGDAPERWAEKIAACAADIGRLRAMRTDVAGWASTEWSWQGCADRYAELLRQCASPDGGDPVRV